VAADLPDHIDDVGPDLFGDLLQLLVGEVLEVARAFYLRKEWFEGLF
jgi:hypothetical protein